MSARHVRIRIVALSTGFIAAKLMKTGAGRAVWAESAIAEIKASWAKKRVGLENNVKITWERRYRRGSRSKTARR